jgi:small ubiquitin-related modifier
MDATPDAPAIMKADPDANDLFITITAKSSSGDCTSFKIKRTTRMQKLIDAYASRLGIDRNSFRVLFDGHPINNDDTPTTLEMENQDVLEIMPTQTGGGFHF